MKNVSLLVIVISSAVTCMAWAEPHSADPTAGRFGTRSQEGLGLINGEVARATGYFAQYLASANLLAQPAANSIQAWPDRQELSVKEGDSYALRDNDLVTGVTPMVLSHYGTKQILTPFDHKCTFEPGHGSRIQLLKIVTDQKGHKGAVISYQQNFGSPNDHPDECRLSMIERMREKDIIAVIPLELLPTAMASADFIKENNRAAQRRLALKNSRLSFFEGLSDFTKAVTGH